MLLVLRAEHDPERLGCPPLRSSGPGSSTRTRFSAQTATALAPYRFVVGRAVSVYVASESIAHRCASQGAEAARGLKASPPGAARPVSAIRGDQRPHITTAPKQ